ncbi:MAG: 1-(5-phosphoribosyl)-5-[(5-phosphoribosylamino)methylideneamino]imidazole-4-carboxamide isomerase [Clostridiales Family XIII bacterium]|jgi:phosphoribosylformimino-5-aminoimidazole carboxamide ribotide isomerase|nr:1-(5-phosphoribosyl)-5-[(5-phosphoribosylamino)methylideneamino]imidazole-4-carboxamide isomerase [Clostridiales Family XIII bacterium]
MIIFPAIDLKDGKPVRLTKGDFATTQQVADDAVITAKKFESMGATHLHMVDLDGALEAKPVNNKIIETVASETNLFIELGGGIRTEETIEHYLKAGISRLILGSVAINDPEFATAMIQKYGEKIAVGIDAKNGMAQGGGWLSGSSVHFATLAKQVDKAGVQTIIYTDIAKDGTLSGPNLEDLGEVNKAVKADVIASGGVTTIDDLKALDEINIHGAICGKSIYKGTLSLEEALKTFA